MGIKGLVFDDRGAPVSNAGIVVNGIEKIVRTTGRGEYWRLLAPGTYYVFAMADGHVPSAPERVVVPKIEPRNWPPKPIIKHFALRRRNPFLG